MNTTVEAKAAPHDGTPPNFEMVGGTLSCDATKKMMEEFGAAFRTLGTIALAGSRVYNSLADTNEVIDDMLNRFANVMKPD